MQVIYIGANMLLSGGEIMKNGIGYVRVSTSEQSDKFGIEAQKEAISKFAKDNGIKIVQWFTDVISGVKEVRPSFNAILYNEDVACPPYDCVIVYKSDRVARDVQLFFYFEFLLRKKGVELIAVNDEFGNVPEAFKNIMKSLTLFFAEQERTNITLRTRAGRRVKADKGGYAGGRVPYGYDAVSGTLQINQAQAEIVRMIFYMSEVQHITQVGICEYLNDNHIYSKSGKLWKQTTVRYILLNKKFYQGYIKYGNDEWVKGQHEAILLADD